MQWLNYHHLYYFYVIAGEGSIALATTRLKLAQSTLSTQLKQFEEAVGYQLFIRANRRLTLTDVGRKVFEYAHEIFSLGQELRETIDHMETSFGALIRLGIMDSVPKQLVRDLFQTVAADHQAKVVIREESLPTLCERLYSHDLDLILANDKPPTENDEGRFHAKLLGQLEVVLVSSTEPITEDAKLFKSLDSQPMIMPGSNSPLRVEISEYLKIKHINPKVVAEVDDVELQKMLVLDGHGFSALPKIAIENELKNGQLHQLMDLPICQENLWLISGHRLVHNPITKRLLNSYRPSYLQAHL